MFGSAETKSWKLPMVLMETHFILIQNWSATQMIGNFWNLISPEPNQIWREAEIFFVGKPFGILNP